MVYLLSLSRELAGDVADGKIGVVKLRVGVGLNDAIWECWSVSDVADSIVQRSAVKA